jgi:hypothetical protein
MSNLQWCCTFQHAPTWSFRVNLDKFQDLWKWILWYPITPLISYHLTMGPIPQNIQCLKTNFTTRWVYRLMGRWVLSNDPYPPPLPPTVGQIVLKCAFVLKPPQRLSKLQNTQLKFSLIQPCQLKYFFSRHFHLFFIT